MGAKLVTINRYLRDPAVRDLTVFTSVASSSAIEGIRAPFVELAGKRTRKKPRATAKLARKKSGARAKHGR